MKLNFDFQGVFKSINLKENFNFHNCISAYKNIKSYAANAFKSCEDDISLFLEGKPFVLSNINYNEIGNKLIKVRKNIENGLKGGKGGFGATIKSQKRKVNVKELTVGLCRDLKTGKRIKDLNNAKDNSGSKTKDNTVVKNCSSVTNSNTVSSKTSESSCSIINYENDLPTQYQSHILNLEDKWKNISSSVDFGMKNMNKKVDV
ncbi:uncharacterized protein cubi_00961 [Cryptosporidium ubiquitum]|uniref:SDE2-like domain-containing protein n=1 Tax=Cryptosporidium ubiquitum TaxID=857276 RepID=A0A1J4M9C1_9CRYT|nr:uncharacterized protein cubi_00961 [Cryptosporidium ubiquitum]OII70816.1 hypothetical protein cubi_00961 [Cryptosporidium ubiquitum]